MSGKGRSQEVRIIGGKWKGRKVRFKGDDHLRPTPGRTRETLFNWLRGHLDGSRCLDLFAGSGALGLEALSRGATHCTFVEQNRRASTELSRALTTLQTTSAATVVTSDARRFLRRTEQTFDLIFLDPPFGEPLLLDQTLALLAERGLIGHWIYIEQPSKASPQGTWSQYALSEWRTTRSGNSTAWLLKKLPCAELAP